MAAGDVRWRTDSALLAGGFLAGSIDLFPLGAGLSRVLDAEDAPHGGQRPAQRRLVIKIAFDDIDAAASQLRRSLALGLARQAAQTEPLAL